MLDTVQKSHVAWDTADDGDIEVYEKNLIENGNGQASSEQVEFETFDQELYREVVEDRKHASKSTKTLGNESKTEASQPADAGQTKPISSTSEFKSDEEISDDMVKTLAMVGFTFFGIILFVMWYMLRSCKNNSKKPEPRTGRKKKSAIRSTSRTENND